MTRSVTPLASYVISTHIRMLIMKDIIIKTATGFVYLYNGGFIEVRTHA